jgi:hypothetical protein
LERDRDKGRQKTWTAFMPSLDKLLLTLEGFTQILIYIPGWLFLLGVSFITLRSYFNSCVSQME